MVNSRFKFRAWEKNLKEIIPVYNIDFEKRMINTDLAWRTFDEVELMQFTGLYDKHHKPIYEGDICETVTYSGKPFGTIDVVKFSGGAFKLTDIEDALLSITLDDSDIQSVEVIGNIYENPELLE